MKVSHTGLKHEGENDEELVLTNSVKSQNLKTILKQITTQCL